MAEGSRGGRWAEEVSEKEDVRSMGLPRVEGGQCHSSFQQGLQVVPSTKY